MHEISFLAKCFNTAGWYIGVTISFYALVLLTLKFFKRRRTADKYAIAGDADIVLMVGFVAVIAVIGDLMGLGVQPDKELSPTGFILSLLCSVGVPILLIWALIWIVGKIRSYIPEEQYDED